MRYLRTWPRVQVPEGFVVHGEINDAEHGLVPQQQRPSPVLRGQRTGRLHRLRESMDGGRRNALSSSGRSSERSTDDRFGFQEQFCCASALYVSVGTTYNSIVVQV